VTTKELDALIAEAEAAGCWLTVDNDGGLRVEARDSIQDHWDRKLQPHWREIVKFLNAEPSPEEIDDDDNDDDVDDGPQHQEFRETGKSERKSQATILVELAGDVEFFHDPGGNPFARVEVDDHQEVVSLRNRGFRRWLARRYYLIEGKAPSAQALQDAIGVLEGKSLYEGHEVEVHLRCAEHGGKVYIDLCNAKWQVVEVDADGWRILDRSPVFFRRAKAMLQLPAPVAGGSVDALRVFLNISDSDWPLIAGWLVGALRPRGPYAVLGVHGEQGSAKSTTCRLLRSLIDPNSAPLRAEPREPRDLAIAANNGWVVALDNVSHISPWLSDGLCRLSTGGGFATRALFENDEEQIFDSQRPLILNGIEELANRSDLLDRCVLINLPRIDSNRRITETELKAEFEQVRPEIFGALLTAVSAAIKNLPTTRLASPPRMADFALWATAAEQGLGLKPGQFIDSYHANRADGNDLAIEACPVGKAIMLLVEGLGAGDLDHWRGTATELLAELGRHVDDSTRKSKAWPASARSLSGAVKRLAPNLRASGVEVEFTRKAGGKRVREIYLAKLEQRDKTSSPSSRPSPDLENSGAEGDASRDATPEGAHGASRPSSRENSVFPEENGVRDARDARDAKKHLCSNVAPETNGAPF